MIKSELVIFCLFLFSVVASFIFAPLMPDLIASHWDINGLPDGYSPKFFNLFMFPSLLLFFFLLFIFVPRIDPLKRNIIKFRKFFDNFIVLISCFFVYLQFLVFFFNLGFDFNMGSMIIPGFSLLIYYSGVLMENTKRNWFIGIKTPWTLSSDKVWFKTHKLGGKVYKIIGVIILAGIAYPSAGFYLMIVPLIFWSLYLIYYSYREYKKEIKG